MNVQKSFQILGLGRSASPKAAKSAYRKLVKTYHPDRFANDPEVIHTAEEKIKQINTAYGRIQSYFSSHSQICQNIKKNKVQTPSTEKPETRSSGIVKKRRSEANHPGLYKQKAQTDFKMIFEQALRAERYRTPHKYVKIESRGNSYIRKIDSRYRYATSCIGKDRDFGPIQEIRPIRPVSPPFL